MVAMCTVTLGKLNDKWIPFLNNSLFADKIGHFSATVYFKTDIYFMFSFVLCILPY